MQITREEHEPPTWAFHGATNHDREALGRFMERWNHGTIVNPWEPFLISFTDTKVIEAFERDFKDHFEQV